MTRFNRSSRIGGGATGTRRCTPGRAMVVALAASVAVLAIGGVSSFTPTGAVLAQTPGTAGPVSLGDLFTGPNTAELKPGAGSTFTDAVRNARAAGDALAPGQCPKPKITVTVPKGDDLFQQALVAARRDALKALLGRDADRFQFVENFVGTTSNVEIDTSVADTAPPTITVTPPSGTKVRNGQRRTITVTATEPSTGWQAGVKQIQIEDLDRHTHLEPWDNPVPAPRPCSNAGLTQTIARSYVVPPDVLVAHLKITVRDYHNPQHAVLVEYPTGDWYGTLEFSSDSVIRGVRTTIKDTMDIVLEHDGKGNLEGTLAGNRSFNQQGSPNCNWTTTIPNKLRGKLLGSYTPSAKAMSIRLVEPVVAPMTKKDCPRGGYIISGYSIHEWPPFKNALSSPRAAGDGTFRFSFEETTTGPVTNRISLTLRPAQN
jgi:hypothetical protein